MTGLVIHHMQPVSDIYHPKTNTAAPGVFYLYSCRAKKCQLNKLWANIKSPVDQLVLTSAHLPHEVLHSTCAQIAQKLAAPRAQSMNITASVFFWGKRLKSTTVCLKNNSPEFLTRFLYPQKPHSPPKIQQNRDRRKITELLRKVQLV